MGTIVTAENFSGGLTQAQKRQLFTEHIQWYRLYGMSMRPVPATWEAFQEYWHHMCHNVLEDNKATAEAPDLTGHVTPPYIAWLPAQLWQPHPIPLPHTTLL